VTPPDSHCSSGDPAERMGNSVMLLWQPDLPPPETTEVDADELRRKAEKARIRAPILKEEAEHRGGAKRVKGADAAPAVVSTRGIGEGI